MSIARHHAEWLSLLEISGPFLSIQVLQAIFPQGLDAHDSEHYSELRAAREEWLDNQAGLHPETAIHTAWIRYVLENTLEYSSDVLASGQAIPSGIGVAFPEHGEVLRPDYMVVEPDDHAPRMLIQTYPAQQSLEHAVANSRWKASPGTRMMELLHATDIKLGLVTNGEQWMLVHAPRGETTGFISWYADLWTEEKLTLRAFRSLLGVQRFFGVPDDQTLEAMIAASAQEQHEVTDQLGKQVRRAVEILVQAIDRANVDRGGTLLTDVDENTLYEAALTVMMRLVFLLSAEERGLLLLGDPIYDQNYAISTLLGQQRELADQQGEEVLERRHDAWSRLLATFRAVYGGIQHDRLRLPAYGSSLFDPDKYPFLEGRQPGTNWRTGPAHPLPINNRTVLHLLEALQYLRVAVPGSSALEARRLSFRALDIEQIGHVYEGLLDHVAVRAEEPVMGINGTKDHEPEIPLSTLESLQATNEDELHAFLKDKTGRTSTSPIINMLAREPEPFRMGRLRAACGNDESLYRRALPYLELLRDDDNGFPIVILPGSLYVTEGPTRRQTGTHYTPRSLTEPIVQHTLEPLVYIGPAEGKPRDQWKLRSAAELLDLKICDMAMGSGAFLVQTCRFLSERLVEAWEEAAGGSLQITPEGKPATGDPAELLIPIDTEERLALARRLIADRCLYGVDKNPLAVEMAKLSLWLITMDKGRAFNFLDHALKCGDSLIGVSLKQLRYWDLQPDDEQEMMIGWILRDEIKDVIRLRLEIGTMPVNNIDDQQHKARILAEANRMTDYLRLAGDHLVSELMFGVEEINVLDRVIQKQPLPPAVQLNSLRPFHWELELPEVFQRQQAGFDAVVGNPPFLGGKKISTYLGDDYRDALNQLIPDSNLNADLCAKFHLRAFEMLCPRGTYGLVSTDRISEGDTKEGGLKPIIRKGGVIYRADTSIPWPGAASVRYSPVHVLFGDYLGDRILNGKKVNAITADLVATTTEMSPESLVRSWGISYVGCAIQGAGFILESAEARALLRENERNNEVVRPFLTGGDLNHVPDQTPQRWVINFDDKPLQVAEEYRTCIDIIRRRVKPYREGVKRKAHRERWWQFGDRRPGLVRACIDRQYVIAVAMTTVEFKFAWVPAWWVFDQTVVVIISDDNDIFAVLESEIHKAWATFQGSGFGSSGSPRYNPTRCFETFAFPSNHSAELNKLGKTYHDFRGESMLELGKGLTDVYTALHNSEENSRRIAHLRELRIEIDNAVSAAYGWDDLDLGHGFQETSQGVRFTISEPARREVLTRLLKLNHERYEEEVRQGLHEKKKGKGRNSKAAKRANPDQPNLL